MGGITRKGFKPGQSGNPGGRPKGLARRIRELVGDDGDRIVSFMIDVVVEPPRTAERVREFPKIAIEMGELEWPPQVKHETAPSRQAVYESGLWTGHRWQFARASVVGARAGSGPG